MTLHGFCVQAYLLLVAMSCMMNDASATASLECRLPCLNGHPRPCFCKNDTNSQVAKKLWPH